MRVLMISHTCQSAAEGLPKAEHLGRLPDVDLCVLVPQRWKHYGHWRDPAPADRGASYRLEVGKVRVPWLGGGIGFYLHWYPGLAKLVRDFKPDVIDLWEEPFGLVSAQACRVRRRWAPHALLLTETEQNINKHLPLPFEKFRSYTLSQADWAIGRSNEAVEVLRQKGYRGPSTVVPNAVDADRFRPMDRDACRRSLGLGSNFIVGFVGRLVEEKGLGDLLAALRLCPPDVSLLIAGEGPLQSTLEAAAAVPGGRIRLLGQLDPSTLPAMMNAVDVLAVPSRSLPRWKEQFGRVIIEAHACGVPVIGSTSGAIPNVVRDGGLVVPEHSPAGLADAIQRLHGDPALARRMGEAGRSQALACCTWQRVAEQMRDVYQQMLDTRLGAIRPETEAVNA